MIPEIISVIESRDVTFLALWQVPLKKIIAYLESQSNYYHEPKPHPTHDPNSH